MVVLFIFQDLLYFQVETKEGPPQVLNCLFFFKLCHEFYDNDNHDETLYKGENDDDDNEDNDGCARR